MTGNFTVLSPEQEERLRKLEAFYTEIRRLARSANLNQFPLIYAALSDLDPKWNERTSN
jgi:hypothetical protein